MLLELGRVATNTLEHSDTVTCLFLEKSELCTRQQSFFCGNELHPEEAEYKEYWHY